LDLTVPPTLAALGYLYQGDYSIPLRAMEELRREGLEVLDLSLGAFKAASLLQHVSPSILVILTAERRGKRELRLYRPGGVVSPFSTWMEISTSVKAYYMDVDTFLKVSRSLGVLPDLTLVLECEVERDEGMELSQWGKECLRMMKEKAMELLRDTSVISTTPLRDLE